MTEIYAIIKETGEYSDRTWDIIQAVTSEDKAKEIVQQLSDEYRLKAHQARINSYVDERYHYEVVELQEWIRLDPIL